MIELVIVVLSVAYALIAALLLNLNVATQYSTLLKSGVITLTSALYIGTWFGYQALTGWATNEALPEEFRVLYISIEERRKASDFGL